VKGAKLNDITQAINLLAVSCFRALSLSLSFSVLNGINCYPPSPVDLY